VARIAGPLPLPDGYVVRSNAGLEIRLTVADRNALVEVGWVEEP
jgi:hypothetical protein